MSPETALWIIGVSVVPWIGWCIYITIQVSNMNAGLIRLLEMHEHPENTGFGTVGLREVIEDNTAAIRALTHYVKWMAKQDGRYPPPPLEST